MTLKRIQRKRTKGWRTPANTKYVGRGSKFGNPFVIGVDGSRDECIYLFKILCKGFLCANSKATMHAQKKLLHAIREDLHEIRGLNLMCFCRPEDSCHADYLLKIANK